MDGAVRAAPGQTVGPQSVEGFLRRQTDPAESAGTAHLSLPCAPLWGAGSPVLTRPGSLNPKHSRGTHRAAGLGRDEAGLPPGVPSKLRCVSRAQAMADTCQGASVTETQL